jgi:GDP-mannose 6-dehydrogenase
MRISIFGLGYVGCVTAACLARQGHHVVGVDTNPFKIDQVLRGEAPFVEKGLEDLIREGREAGRLHATRDAEEAVRETEISLVCVGTPSLRNNDLDTSHVQKVAEDIGGALAGKQSYHLVVVRSTLLPGSTQKLVIPALEKAGGKRVDRDFGVCYNPEFLREGSAVFDFHHPPKTVIGESVPADGERVAALYSGLDAPLIRTEIPVAEMVKYVDNAFHALKITFVNEIGRICKAHGIDSHRVTDIFLQDHKLNISEAYLRPGFAFGGSCLPKDLRALVYRAGQRDVQVPLLRSTLESNRQQVRIAVDRILETGKKKIGFLGLSFKAETDDLRESPLVEVIETLLGKGYEVRIFDPNVSLSRLHGANREYMEEHLPHLSALLTDSLAEVMEVCEVIVFGNRSPAAAEALARSRPGQILLDLVRVAERPETRGRYDGISW